VLDLSRVLAGPWCGQVLADLGAEVIKIERPGSGDDTRAWGPPYARDAERRETSESAYFLSANRGKDSVTIDLTRPEGQSLLQELAGKSDVLIENYKVGGLKKYRLDYPTLSALNPGLIYCSITGFGQNGPYAQRPGYDFMIQAMGGLMSVTGEPDETPGGGPEKVGVALADILTGLYATIGILGALAHRDRTGEGQYIDLALLDVQVACLANQAMNYLVSGHPPERLGNAHPNIVPYQAFAAADGHFILAVGNDAQFARLCNLLGESEWAENPRFATNAQRVAHRTELVPMLQRHFGRLGVDQWLTRLEKVEIPCGPINTLDRVFDDPQVHHRGMRLDLPHPTAGTVPQVASPLNMSRTPVGATKAPPLLGEDGESVLSRVLGLAPDRLRRLRETGII
jgi:crotonobetainyl-CoA:carnitine CoA-transferase CaiB-like acyl-CoA transferase